MKASSSEFSLNDLHADEDLFIALLKEHYASIFEAILLIIPNRRYVDDIMQEVCVQLWRNFASFDRKRSFSLWARGVAFNVTREYLRKESRHRSQILSDEVLTKIHYQYEGTSELVELYHELLNDCLSHLTKRERELVHEVYAKGTAIKALADEKGRSANGTYVALTRIRKRLMDCIDRKMKRGEFDVDRA